MESVPQQFTKKDFIQNENSKSTTEKTEYDAGEEITEEDFIDWAKEEHDYEHGYFVCKWVKDRSAVVDHKNVPEDLICNEEHSLMSAFVEHSKSHLER